MGFLNSLHQRRMGSNGKFDPAGFQMDKWLGLSPKEPPPVPSAPTQDLAANAAMQSQDEMRRRRGVLSNIYGGGSSSTAPSVGSNTLLGT